MNKLGLTQLLIVIAVIMPWQGLGAQHEEDFASFCSEGFKAKGECPKDICETKCEILKQGEPCQNLCLPKPCPEIGRKECPEKFCTVMENCSKEKICHYQMTGEPARCGDLSYAGQDVECCQGLIRRCGVEFLDGTCDMEGKNSVDNLPICIPCGNGICNQFENRCNCPEDCGKPPDIPLIPNL